MSELNKARLASKKVSSVVFFSNINQMYLFKPYINMSELTHDNKPVFLFANLSVHVCACTELFLTFFLFTWNELSTQQSTFSRFQHIK